ncbi:helix-turn-helix domain-containing protein [Maribacter cobaltidurans]|uniref:AraC family transcriptional regulator n=1 Tax=Maribacter cobaltidurans TaxID=1178778 RepID=A0A223V4N5_9FLAO|nr:helix-turn-helix domain-containing protein [Maribacter cobaltidurans]ASV29968.1 AraC family transcriptional regulator [Maribacter cobaltidurans]GGD88300.1 transcriptional regulator [Maribacter cobaltidurans]
MKNKASTLINETNGELAFKLFSFSDDSNFDHIQRHNYYSIILLLKGEAQLQIELEKYTISNKKVICISPYQPYSLKSIKLISGIVLNFHSDFFCTYKHQNEIETEGILFHNIFGPSFFNLPNEETLLNIMTQMELEITHGKIGQHESLVSYLKIFLISILRIKNLDTDSEKIASKGNSKPQILQSLINSIEANYKTKHTPKDYSEVLNISSTVLSKLVKDYFNKTLTKLIAQRIVVEAKRELYLTSKSVKEVAFLLGYTDEYYFSRFFKKQVGVSPNIYRKTVGFAKAER